MDSLSSERSLFDEISKLIEQNKRIVASHANSTLTLMFWRIGRLVNGAILQNERAEYGKQIVVTLTRQLSWSHFLALIPLKSKDAQLFYAKEASAQQFEGVDFLMIFIFRMLYLQVFKHIMSLPKQHSQ
jgi:hypothetical protein